MKAVITDMVERFEGGRLSRRELIQGLSALTAAAATGSVSGAATPEGLKGTGIDHVSVLARDLQRSTEFYQSVFGFTVLSEDKEHRIFNPAGYLLVAECVTGDLYKVPVADPKKFSKVKVQDSLAGADGLVPHPNGSVIVVRNDNSLSAVALGSTDDWATASLAGKGTYALQATTGAVAGDDVYVVHPHFSDANAMPSIEKVALQ